MTKQEYMDKFEAFVRDKHNKLLLAKTISFPQIIELTAEFCMELEKEK